MLRCDRCDRETDTGVAAVIGERELWLCLVCETALKLWWLEGLAAHA